ncbi:hypothetical protein [Bacillus sp. Marseille-Q3570]|uniref:hypothetical protein n=1 Tax=Bacillus sp. Marseille-Q3570 TaxID=2963522 RepID=UPI0021B7F0CF|nr:hypothetical protein [Bacillus sp. Marseille-Q3570]
MQVDINLLPQKKTSSSKNRKMVLLLLAIIITGIVGITTTKIFAMLEIADLEKQVEILQDERSNIERQLNKSTDNSQEMLKELNKLITSRIATTDVIDEILGPLKKGSIEQIGYSESGTVTLGTTFTQLEEIAEYQRKLLESDGIIDVTIIRVSRNDQESEQLAEVLEGETKETSETQETSKNYYADFEIAYHTERFTKKGGGG